MVDADGSGQETVLSRFRVTFVFFFLEIVISLLEIVILFPVFSFIVDKSDILFYMANFFFQFCENSFIFGIVY